MFNRYWILLLCGLILQGCATGNLSTSSSSQDKLQESSEAKAEAEGSETDDSKPVNNHEISLSSGLSKAFSACIDAYEGKDYLTIYETLKSEGFRQSSPANNFYYTVGERTTTLGFKVKETIKLTINPVSFFSRSKGCEVTSSEGRSDVADFAAGMYLAFLRAGYHIELKGKGRYEFSKGDTNDVATLTVFKGKRFSNLEAKIVR